MLQFSLLRLTESLQRLEQLHCVFLSPVSNRDVLNKYFMGKEMGKQERTEKHKKEKEFKLQNA